MTGPRSVAGSSGSPIVIVLARSISRSTNLSCTVAATMTRVPDSHAWPWFIRQPNSVPSAARSRSASSRTMFGPLPPSSSVSRLTLPAAIRMISRPTAVEPVKAIFRTSGWLASRAPTTWPSPGTTFRTPGGSPHSCAILANSSSVSGVCSSGLTTMVLPAASAGPIFHMASSSGKFHGTMAAHTPTGSRRTMPLASVGTRSSGPGRSKA